MEVLETEKETQTRDLAAQFFLKDCMIPAALESWFRGQCSDGALMYLLEFQKGLAEMNARIQLAAEAEPGDEHEQGVPA